MGCVMRDGGRGEVARKVKAQVSLSDAEYDDIFSTVINAPYVEPDRTSKVTLGQNYAKGARSPKAKERKSVAEELQKKSFPAPKKGISADSKTPDSQKIIPKFNAPIKSPMVTEMSKNSIKERNSKGFVSPVFTKSSDVNKQEKTTEEKKSSLKSFERGNNADKVKKKNEKQSKKHYSEGSSSKQTDKQEYHDSNRIVAMTASSDSNRPGATSVSNDRNRAVAMGVSCEKDKALNKKKEDKAKSAPVGQKVEKFIKEPANKVHAKEKEEKEKGEKKFELSRNKTTKNEKDKKKTRKSLKPSSEIPQSQNSTLSEMLQASEEFQNPSVSQRSSRELSVAPPNISPRQRLEWLRDRRPTGIWVQCCKKYCMKWRFLNDTVDPVEVPEVWVCTMHKEEELALSTSDPRFNSCDKAEKGPSLMEQLDLIDIKYTAGTIVWAKLTGYPWWPAMVDDDPDTEQFFWLNGFSDISTHYHVVFLDEKPTRAWIAANSLARFQGNETDRKYNNSTLKGINYSAKLKIAKGNAMKACKLDLGRRLKTFGFISRYAGPVGQKLYADDRMMMSLSENDSASTNGMDLDVSNSRGQKRKKQPKEAKVVKRTKKSEEKQSKERKSRPKEKRKSKKKVETELSSSSESDFIWDTDSEISNFHFTTSMEETFDIVASVESRSNSEAFDSMIGLFENQAPGNAERQTKEVENNKQTKKQNKIPGKSVEDKDLSKGGTKDMKKVHDDDDDDVVSEGDVSVEVASLPAPDSSINEEEHENESENEKASYDKPDDTLSEKMSGIYSTDTEVAGILSDAEKRRKEKDNGNGSNGSQDPDAESQDQFDCSMEANVANDTELESQVLTYESDANLKESETGETEEEERARGNGSEENESTSDESDPFECSDKE